jgi:FkbM family methyltransferase
LSTIVDVGCGYKAELAQFFLDRYQVKAYIIDPTLKHKAALEKLAEKYSKTLCYLGYAVSSNDSEIEFYETLDHESGSILEDHLNIKRDTIRKYKVRSITLQTLLKEINAKTIDFIKLDLEGAEYELIESMTRETVKPFKQIFIEFHHHAFKRFTRSMTRRAVKHLKKLGLKAFTLDTNNYLFYRN